MYDPITIDKFQQELSKEYEKLKTNTNMEQVLGGQEVIIAMMRVLLHMKQTELAGINNLN